MLNKFINDGGISRIGQTPFALLAFIVTKAKEQSYPEKVMIDVRESMYKARINSHQHLAHIRKKLLENNCIKDYRPGRDEGCNQDVGFYFLNYDSKKGKNTA